MKAVTLSFEKVETKRIDISQGDCKMPRNIMVSMSYSGTGKNLASREWQPFSRPA